MNILVLGWVAGIFFILCWSLSADGQAVELTSINTLPARYARPNTGVIVWGNINRGSVRECSGLDYEWSFVHGEDISVSADPAVMSGEVADGRNIRIEAEFDLIDVTRARAEAVLRVFDGERELTSTSMITVVSPLDASSDTPAEAMEIDRKIAIEKALCWLYLQGADAGEWEESWPGLGDGKPVAMTAMALWAFANNQHLPSNNPEYDVYQPAVKRWLEEILELSEIQPVAVTPRGDPDMNGNGRGVILGGTNSKKNGLPSMGYTVPMCLAALCATGTPFASTSTPPFSNDGDGTPFLDIVQDTVDFILWWQGRNDVGGWGYGFLDGQVDDSDLSVGNWNVVALDAARRFGADVPLWSQAHHEAGLEESYVGDEAKWYFGAFCYRGLGTHITPATCASAVTGMVYAGTGGRISDMDIGRKSLNCLRMIGEHWYRMPATPKHIPRVNHGEGYQMWCMARGLRMAFVDHLNGPSGIFDWENNASSATGSYGGVTEGLRDYIIRRQRDDGRCRKGKTLRYYGETLDTAWGVLVLSEGIVGTRQSLRDVELKVRLPADAGVTLDPGSFSGAVPDIVEGSDHRELSWFLDALYQGDRIDLSWEQVLTGLSPGEDVTVLEAVTAGYSTYTAGYVEQTYGPLEVAVGSSFYELTVDSDSDEYTPGQTAVITTQVRLPGGNGLCRIDRPGPGRLLIEPQLGDTGAAWTAVEFELTNRDEFSSGSTPVSIRSRSDATLAGLQNRDFAPAVSVSGSLLPCPPGRLLELDIGTESTPGGQAAELDFLQVFYVTGSPRMLVDVADSTGQTIASLGEYPFPVSAFGENRAFTHRWTIPETEAGDFLVKARIIESDTEKIRSESPFAVVRPPPPRLSSFVSTDRSVYSSGESVEISSGVLNSTSGGTAEDLSVEIEVTTADGSVVENGQFSYQVERLAPGAESGRILTWETALSAPGTYTVGQGVSGDSCDPLAEQVTFEIGRSIDFGMGLTGWVRPVPEIVSKGGQFNAEWELENTGNSDLGEFTVALKLISSDVPASSQALKWSHGSACAGLARGTEVTGKREGIATDPLVIGDYILLLQVIRDTRGAGPGTVALGRLTVEDRNPPVTTHDYAHEDEWTNQASEISFSAVDAEGSGIKQTSITVAGETIVTDTYSVGEEGITDLLYRSEDNAGNVEEDKTCTIKFDTVPPDISCDYASQSGWEDAPREIAFSAEDAHSGVALLEYALDGGAAVADRDRFTVDGSGEHSVMLSAVDNAGNRVESEMSIRLDLEPPTVSHDYAGAQGWVLPPSRIRIQADDEHSGVAETWYVLNDGPRVQTDTLTVTEPGVNSLTIGATDGVGHEATAELQVKIRAAGGGATYYGFQGGLSSESGTGDSAEAFGVGELEKVAGSDRYRPASPYYAPDSPGVSPRAPGTPGRPPPSRGPGTITQRPPLPTRHQRELLPRRVPDAVPSGSRSADREPDSAVIKVGTDRGILESSAGRASVTPASPPLDSGPSSASPGGNASRVVGQSVSARSGVSAGWMLCLVAGGLFLLLAAGSIPRRPAVIFADRSGGGEVLRCPGAGQLLRRMQQRVREGGDTDALIIRGQQNREGILLRGRQGPSAALMVRGEEVLLKRVTRDGESTEIDEIPVAGLIEKILRPGGAILFDGTRGGGERAMLGKSLSRALPGHPVRSNAPFSPTRVPGLRNVLRRVHCYRDGKFIETQWHIGTRKLLDP